MKIISQISLFDDTQNENLGDLERLQKVIEHMPDEKLIRKLEEIRGKGCCLCFVGAYPRCRI